MWFKALKFFWPFLRELLLGDLSLKQAVQTHKMRVLALGMVLLSLSLNMFGFPRLVTITRQHLALIKDYQELSAKYALATQEVCIGPQAALPTTEEVRDATADLAPEPKKAGKSTNNGKSVAHHPNADEQLYKELREHFKKLQQEENNE